MTAFNRTWPVAGTGRLVVDAQSDLFWGENTPRALGPMIKVNGEEVAGQWGENPVDLLAGDHQLFVSTRYLGGVGPAELDVTVRAGETTTVYYRAPAGPLGTATLDLTPREPSHSTAMVIIAVVFVFLLIAAVIIGIVV